MLAMTPPLELGVDVEVRPSEGMGDGLFCKRAISKGEYLFDYLGEQLTEQQVS